LGFGPKLSAQSVFRERAWARFQGFQVSEFQGFKSLKDLGFELEIEVEFLRPPALFEHFETLKL
jgi:hypothetical protein